MNLNVSGHHLEITVGVLRTEMYTGDPARRVCNDLVLTQMAA